MVMPVLWLACSGSGRWSTACSGLIVEAYPSLAARAFARTVVRDAGQSPGRRTSRSDVTSCGTSCAPGVAAVSLSAESATVAASDV